MAVKQLSDGNPDGTTLGQNASDIIGFHGATPVAQGSAVTTMATIPTTFTDGTISVRLNTLIGKVNSLATTLRNKGLIAT